MPHGDILGFAPPLVITRDEVDDVVKRVVRAVEKGYPEDLDGARLRLARWEGFACGTSFGAALRLRATPLLNEGSRSGTAEDRVLLSLEPACIPTPVRPSRNPSSSESSP